MAFTIIASSCWSLLHVLNTLILCVLFAFNFITGNLMPEPANCDFPDHERPFLMVQNSLFTMSSYISLVLVMERMFAVRNAAVYERSERHLVSLLILIAGYNLIFQSIAVTYAVEGSTLMISLAIIIYSGRKLQRIPFGEDRLKAYQVFFSVKSTRPRSQKTAYSDMHDKVKEVLKFSLAILPSVVVSSVMHTLSHYC